MALKNIFNILVDLKIVRSINQPLVTQNDSVVFILEVMDNGVPFDLTDTTTISLAHTRKDGTVVVTPGTKVGNVATFELGTNETAVAGGVIAKAQFYGADGRVSTLSFGYQVGQDPTGSGYVPSEVEQTLIEVVLNDGPLIIASAEEAAAYANEQGDYALEVAAKNETRFLNAVSTVALRDSTYPAPSHGDTVRVTGTSTSYRYVLGTGWVVTDVYNPTAIDEVNQQLADTSNQTGLIGVKGKTTVEPTRGMVTFFTDDGNSRDYTVFKDIFATAGVPCCTGIIPNRVGTAGNCTLAQIRELQDVYGWEIASHTHTHPSLTSLTEQQVDDEFRLSKEYLVSNGFKVESLAYPYGHFGEREKRLVRKYYRSARQSGRSDKGYNTTPLSSYELNTHWIDEAVSNLPNENGFAVNTFDYYKALIDKAAADKRWLMISFHSWDTGASATLLPIFVDVLNYAKSVCDIVTMSEALDRVGNIIDLGTGGKSNPQDEYFAVGFDGVAKSDRMVVKYAGIDEFDGNTPLLNFPKYTLTINPVKSALGLSSNLPGGSSGLLQTYRFVESTLTLTYNYQLYSRTHTTDVFRRNALVDGTWGAWLKMSSDARVDSTFLMNTPLSSYPIGVTFTPMKKTDVNLVPVDSAGALLTYKMSSITADSPYSYQEFKVYNSNATYRRNADAAGAWGAWVKSHAEFSIANGNQYSPLTPIADFPIGVLRNTVSSTLVAESSPPETASGVLTTHKISTTNHTFNWQEYHVAGTNRLYKRSFALDGTPIAWAKISAV